MESLASARAGQPPLNRTCSIVPSGLNIPAQGAGAVLIGLVPVLGQGFNPRPAREVPGLDHGFRDLVGRGPTAGEEGVNLREGHVGRVKVLATEPLLPQLI